MAEEGLINQEEHFVDSENITCPVFTRTDASLLIELRFWVGGVANCIIAVLGVLINIVSAYVLLTNQVLKNTFNKLLSVLLIIDSICLFFIINDVLYHTFKVSTGLYEMFIPYFFHPFRNISLTASIFMTIAIAHERYEAIRHPFTHLQKRSAMLLIKDTSIVIFCSILINVPKFFESELNWTCRNETLSFKGDNTSNMEVDNR